MLSSISSLTLVSLKDKTNTHAHRLKHMPREKSTCSLSSANEDVKVVMETASYVQYSGDK